MKQKTDIVRSFDKRVERWLWVDGKKAAYICDTHDEYMHFVARACEHGDTPRFELFWKEAA